MKHCLIFPEFSTEAVEITEMNIEQVTKAKQILMDKWGYTRYNVVYLEGNPSGYIQTDEDGHLFKTIEFIIIPLITLP